MQYSYRPTYHPEDKCNVFQITYWDKISNCWLIAHAIEPFTSEIEAQQFVEKINGKEVT